MGTKKKNVLCAGAIVFRLNEYGRIEFLLIKDSREKHDRWSVPKGHCELNESIEETAVRECWEETGVVARLLYELPPTFTSNTMENKTVHIFLAKQLNPQHGVNCKDEDIAEAKWFDISELPEVYTYQKPIVAHATNIIKKNMA